MYVCMIESVIAFLSFSIIIFNFNYQMCLKFNFNTGNQIKPTKTRKVSNDITSKSDRRKHLPVFSRYDERNVDFLNSKTTNVTVTG